MACRSGCGGSAELPLGVHLSQLTYRLMESTASSPDECMARDDSGRCLDFPSLAAATAYKEANGSPGTPMGVLA